MGDQVPTVRLLMGLLIIYEALILFMLLGHGFASLALTLDLGYTAPIRNIEFWPFGLGLIIFIVGLSYHPDTFETKEDASLYTVIGLFGVVLTLVGVWLNFAFKQDIPSFFIAMGATLMVVFWIHRTVKATG